jgi:hypothetical protein
MTPIHGGAQEKRPNADASGLRHEFVEMIRAEF